MVRSVVVLSFGALVACGSAPAAGDEDTARSAQAFSTSWSMTSLGVMSSLGVSAVAQNTSGTPVDVFYVSTDVSRTLMWKHFDTIHGWSSPAALASGLAMAPTANTDGQGDIVVTYVTSSKSLCYVQSISPGGWGSPSCGSVPMPDIASPISVVEVGWWNHLFFFRGLNGNLKRYESNVRGYASVIDTGIAIAGAPSAVRRPSNGQMNVFFRGLNGHLFDTWYDGATWHAAWDHGIAIGTDPSAIVSSYDARIDVYYGVPGSVWSARDLSRTTWTPWTMWSGSTDLGVLMTGTPAATGAKQAFVTAALGLGVYEADDTTFY